MLGQMAGGKDGSQKLLHTGVSVGNENIYRVGFMKV